MISEATPFLVLEHLRQNGSMLRSKADADVHANIYMKGMSELSFIPVASYLSLSSAHN